MDIVHAPWLSMYMDTCPSDLITMVTNNQNMITMVTWGVRRKEQTPYLQTLGERIARGRGHIRREDFAASVGISLTSLAQIETGYNAPSIPTLIRIAAKLRLSIDELLQGLPLPPIRVR